MGFRVTSWRTRSELLRSSEGCSLPIHCPSSLLSLQRNLPPCSKSKLLQHPTLTIHPTHLLPLCPSHRFHPKEDVASSTSMKSSIQRQHRAKLLSQLPYLSLPAVAPLKISHRDEEEEEEDHSQRKKDKKGGGGGGGGGKGGKGGKGKKGREEQVEEVVVKEEEEVGEEVLTVLDVIWPKKEQLTFVKWSVPRARLSLPSSSYVQQLIFNGQSRSYFNPSPPWRTTLLPTFRRSLLPYSTTPSSLCVFLAVSLLSRAPCTAH